MTYKVAIEIKKTVRALEEIKREHPNIQSTVDETLAVLATVWKRSTKELRNLAKQPQCPISNIISDVLAARVQAAKKRRIERERALFSLEARARLI